VKVWLGQYTYLEGEWPGEKLLAFAMNSVTGIARKWALAMEEIQFTNYSTFKKAMMLKY
jgi:hypothetical protein